MATTALITTARRALWNALDAFPALKNSADDPTATLFHQRFDFESEAATFEALEPSISDFPCIMIAPASVNPLWYLNQMQNWQIIFQVTIWTADWTLPELENLIERTAEAFFQAVPDDGTGSTVPIVKGTVGFYPMLGHFVISPANVGQERETKATRVQMQLTLSNNKNPIGVSTQ